MSYRLFLLIHGFFHLFNMPPQITAPADEASSFEIKIDFEKHSEQPGRVFQSMAQMIESFHLIDNDLLLPFDIRAETFLILEDIKTGSLRTRLTTMLRSVDDEALKEGEIKKIIGNYLLKGKYRLIHFLENKKQITDRSEIEALGTDLYQLAVETDVKKLPSYKRVPSSALLRDIQLITLAVEQLKPADTAKFITQNGEVQFNQSFQYHQDAVETLLTKETKNFEKSEILKVKKPDYLGDSMWELKYRDRIIPVKITDHNWLFEFQSRKKDVRPGDALSVVLQTQINYGFQDEEISVHYRILKVKEIIPDESPEQGNLIPP
jgi:hypothetical protein